jgi:hypothetical protein
MNPDGLSYESDIVPLKQQFFRRSYSEGRNPVTGSALTSSFSANADSVFKGQQDLRDQLSVARNRELQYETAKFTLEREREKAAEQRDMIKNFVPFQQQLDSIITDDKIDYATRQKEFGRFAVQNAGLLATNPAAATAYNAAARAITPDEKTTFTLGSFVERGGDPRYLQKYLDTLGEPVNENTYIPPFEFAKGLGDVIAGSATAAERAKRQVAEERERRANMENLFDFAKGAKFFETKGGLVDETKFDSPISEAAIREIIAVHGSPEEQKAAVGKTAKELIDIAAPIMTAELSGRRKASTNVAGSVRSGFTSKPK